MNFEPNEEQAAALAALDRILQPYRALAPNELVQRSVYSSRLQADLHEAGFFDFETDLAGRMTGALVIAELSRLPVCVQATASILVRPGTCPSTAAPLALIWGDPSKPVRFLPQPQTALLVDQSGIRALQLAQGDVKEVHALFAYPVGRLTDQALRHARELMPTPVADTLSSWRLGLALEIFGALHAASELTLEHVTQRRQFGQPLGALQAIQHRMAMDATTLQAIRWLALKAASSGLDADAALAAAYAQQAVSAITYNLHQFSGAMGLTLEYPLHLFTYRAVYI
jgi:hypothetical protein